MAAQEYINVNGSYLKKEEAVLKTNNRMFLFFDGFHENMFATATNVAFSGIHFENIRKKALLYGFQLPDKLNNADLFSKEMYYLLNRNKHFQATRVRLTIYRKNSDNSTKISRETEYIVETEKLAGSEYAINERGLKIDFFTEFKLNNDNSFLFHIEKNGLTGHFINFNTKNILDDCILLNSCSQLLESCFSCIFIIKNDILYTPDINCITDNTVIRQVILNIARAQNINIIQTEILTADDLLGADEVFLADAINGIRWVSALQNRRYFNRFAKKIVPELNKHLSV